MSIHSSNDQIILEFGLKKPAFRIVVNTPTTHGSIGLTTGLDPAMTLGCGGWGGNITSDNISPKHLLNIKRLAYELSPAVPQGEGLPMEAARRPAAAALPGVAAASRPAPAAGISADALTRRIDEFLGSRGYGERVQASETRSMKQDTAWPATGQTPLDFVCEDDVRAAIQTGRKLVVSERAIVTPSARDLAEAHRVFSLAPWRG
jgi:acetaldehyde dehydrogenase (acetylating)